MNKSNVIDFAARRRQQVTEQNKEIISRIKNADDELTRYNSEDTWYPSRGVFDKKLGRMVPVRPTSPESR
jgi:hypothetical protein